MFVVGGESLIDLVSASRSAPDGVIAHDRARRGARPSTARMALARLGNDTGFLCPISRDRFGELLLGPLLADGVEPLLPERGVRADDARRGDPRRQEEGAVRVLSRRRPGLHARGAARRRCPAKLDVSPDRRVCPTGGRGARPSGLTVAGAALAAGATISIDPNVRPLAIGDMAAYKRQLDSLLDLAHLIKMSKRRPRVARSGQLDRGARALRCLTRPNCELVVVTLADEGSLRVHRERLGDGRHLRRQPVFGDTVGAGDTPDGGDHHMAQRQRAIWRRSGLKQLDQPALDAMLRFGAVAAGHQLQPGGRQSADARRGRRGAGRMRFTTVVGCRTQSPLISFARVIRGMACVGGFGFSQFLPSSASASRIYMLRPVRGPERDLTLTADATHGAYLIRLGGCVSCHTDRKNGVAELGGGAGHSRRRSARSIRPTSRLIPKPASATGRWSSSRMR